MHTTKCMELKNISSLVTCWILTQLLLATGDVLLTWCLTDFICTESASAPQNSDSHAASPAHEDKASVNASYEGTGASAPQSINEDEGPLDEDSDSDEEGQPPPAKTSLLDIPGIMKKLTRPLITLGSPAAPVTDASKSPMFMVAGDAAPSRGASPPMARSAINGATSDERSRFFVCTPNPKPSLLSVPTLGSGWGNSAKVRISRKHFQFKKKKPVDEPSDSEENEAGVSSQDNEYSPGADLTPQQMFEVATQEVWKRANQRPSALPVCVLSSKAQGGTSGGHRRPFNALPRSCANVRACKTASSGMSAVLERGVGFPKGLRQVAGAKAWRLSALKAARRSDARPAQFMVERARKMPACRVAAEPSSSNIATGTARATLSPASSGGHEVRSFVLSGTR